MTENQAHGSRRSRETTTAAATNPTSSQWLLRNGASSHTESSTSAAVAPSVRRSGRATSRTASSPSTVETTISAVDPAKSPERADGGLPARCAMTAMPNVRANHRHGSGIASALRDESVTDLLCPAARSLDGF